MEGMKNHCELLDVIDNVIPYLTLKEGLRLRLLTKDFQIAFGRMKLIVIRCHKENSKHGPPLSIWNTIIACRLTIADDWNPRYLNLDCGDWQSKIRDLKILRIHCDGILDLKRMEQLSRVSLNYSSFSDISLPSDLKSITVKESTLTNQAPETSRSFFWKTRHLPRSLRSIEFTSVLVKNLDLTEHDELQEFIIDGGAYDSLVFPRVLEEVAVLTLPVIEASVLKLWDCILAIEDIDRLCLSPNVNEWLEITGHEIIKKKGLVIYSL